MDEKKLEQLRNEMINANKAYNDFIHSRSKSKTEAEETFFKPMEVSIPESISEFTVTSDNIEELTVLYHGMILAQENFMEAYREFTEKQIEENEQN